MSNLLLQWFPKSGLGVRKKNKFLYLVDSPRVIIAVRKCEGEKHGGKKQAESIRISD